MVFASIFSANNLPVLLGLLGAVALVLIVFACVAVADMRMGRLAPKLLELRDKMNYKHRWHFCVRGVYPSLAARKAFAACEETRDKALSLYNQGAFGLANEAAAEGLVQLSEFDVTLRQS